MKIHTFLRFYWIILEIYYLCNMYIFYVTISLFYVIFLSGPNLCDSIQARHQGSSTNELIHDLGYQPFDLTGLQLPHVTDIPESFTVWPVETSAMAFKAGCFKCLQFYRPWFALWHVWDQYEKNIHIVHVSFYMIHISISAWSDKQVNKLYYFKR